VEEKAMAADGNGTTVHNRLSEQQRSALRELMKQGYRAMGQINLALAEEGPAFETPLQVEAWPGVGGE